MIFPHSIGIYIESDRAAIILTALRFGRLQVLAEKMLYVNPEKKPDARLKEIRDALADMVQKYRMTGPVLYLGIPREHCVIKFIDFPVSVKENLRETVAYEMIKYVPFSENEIYFDCQILSEDKEKGRISVLLAVVKKEIIAPYLKIADGMAIDLAGIDISANAIARFFEKEKQSVHPHFGVVYGNAHIWEFIGIRKNRLQYSRCIKISNTGEALKEGISVELAAMTQHMASENDQNHFKIFFCSKEVPDGLIDQLREADYPSIAPVDFSETDISDPAMITAFGLSVKGVQKVSPGLNLLPVALQKEIGRTGANCFYILVCLLLLSSGLWSGGHFFDNRQDLNHLQTAVENIQQSLDQMTAAAAESQKIQSRVDFLKFFPARDGRLIDILNELSERLPETAWINSFNFSKGRVKLEGVAANAAELISLIEASPHLSGAAFMSTIRKDNEGKENFTIGLDVDASSFK